MKPVIMSKRISARNQYVSEQTKCDDEIPQWASKFKDEMRDMMKDVMGESLAEINSKLNNLDTKSDVLEKKVSTQHEMISDLQTENSKLMDRLIKLECRSMSDNLIISGIKECPDEDEQTIRETLTFLFADDMDIADDIHIVRCHRLCKLKNSSQGTFSVVRLENCEDVDTILKSGRKLAGHDPAVFINRQFPPKSLNKETYYCQSTRKPNS